MAVKSYMGKFSEEDYEKLEFNTYAGRLPVQLRTGEAGLFKVSNVQYHNDDTTTGHIDIGPIQSEMIQRALNEGRIYIGFLRRATHPAERGSTKPTKHSQGAGRRQWYTHWAQCYPIGPNGCDFELAKPQILSTCLSVAGRNGYTPFMKTRLEIFIVNSGGPWNIEEQGRPPHIFKLYTVRNSEHTFYYPELQEG